MTTLLIYNISDFCNLGILFCSSSILDKIVSHIILLSLKLMKIFTLNFTVVINF